MLLPTWPAGADGGGGAAAIRVDCGRHGGVVAEVASRGSLVAAYRAERNKSSACAQGIASALALTAPSGRESQIVSDCIAHAGRLTRAYSARALLEARARSSRATLSENRCLIGILTELRQQRYAVIPRIPPDVEHVLTPADSSPASQVAASFAPMFSPFRRAATGNDALAPRAQNLLTYENAQFAAGHDLSSARRLGSTRNELWAYVSLGSLCTIRVFGTVAAGTLCEPASAAARSELLPIMSPHTAANNWELWGAALDGVKEVEIMTTPGHSVQRPIVNNGFLIILKRLPIEVSWRDTHGRAHYFQTATFPCGPPACARLPDPVAASDVRRRRRGQP